MNCFLFNFSTFLSWMLCFKRLSKAKFNSVFCSFKFSSRFSISNHTCFVSPDSTDVHSLKIQGNGSLKFFFQNYFQGINYHEDNFNKMFIFQYFNVYIDNCAFHSLKIINNLLCKLYL